MVSRHVNWQADREANSQAVQAVKMHAGQECTLSPHEVRLIYGQLYSDVRLTVSDTSTPKSG